MSETKSDQEGFIEMIFEEISAVEMLERANEYFLSLIHISEPTRPY